MNQLQILTAMLDAAIKDPAAVSAFVQRDINSEVPDPFLTLMPRDPGSSYSFDGSSLDMVVTPLLPVAMNSPFPKVGAVTSDVWRGETDKYAGEIPLDEKALRSIQEKLLRLPTSSLNQAGVKSVQEFLQRLLGNLRNAADLSEKLARSEAVMTGKYVGKAELFGVKGANLIGAADYKVQRIIAKTAHDKAGSTFWTDLRDGESALQSTVSKRYISEKTLIAVKGTAANGIIETRPRVTGENGTYTVWLSRMAQKQDGSYDTLSQNFDAEFRDIEFTVVKTQKIQVPGANGKLVKLSFGTDGTIALIGSPRIGQLYVAPTVEGTLKGVASDRFAWLESPRAWEVAARCVENFVPVITQNKDVCIIETKITLP